MLDRGLSLRKKILLLATLPAAFACVALAMLTWLGGLKAKQQVTEDVTAFMLERTKRSLGHADRSADVTYTLVSEILRGQVTTGQLLIGSRGGASLSGATAPHALISDDAHVGGSQQLPVMHLGGEALDGAGRSVIVQEIAHQTNATVIVFQRIVGAGELIRLASSSPHSQPGSFLTSVSADPGKPAPDATLIGGNEWVGRTMEAGQWQLGRYEPLRDGKGMVIGALYVGVPIRGLTTLTRELAANSIGNRGSVSVFFAHGPERGQMLVTPSGLGEATRSMWEPIALENAPKLKEGQQDGLVLPDPKTNSNAVIRYTYLPHLDWVLVVIADTQELRDASAGVNNTFEQVFHAGALFSVVLLSLIGILAWVYSRRIIDPLMEITIQLTSNGTQVASSAKQQLDSATSFNVSSTEIATAVKEISSTSQELLRAMEEVAQESVRASATAREGSTGLKVLTQSIDTLNSATHHITSSLRTIRERAARINTVTLAVTKVADQTNLLSLNAAIEAEKAGEAGAGFGVVAREVRRLADQSARASQQIEETIQEMQEAVNSGVDQVQSLGAAMEDSIRTADRIREQFTEIIERVEAMTPRYERLHVGMQNQTEGAQQISEAMWQLSETANQTSDSIAELNGVSHELHEAVRTLKQRVFEGAA